MPSNVAEAILIDNTTYSLTVYPNPTEGKIFLSYRSSITGNMFIKIYDATGKIVMSQKRTMNIGEEIIEMDLNSLSAANYNVEVSVDGKVETFRILKVK